MRFRNLRNWDSPAESSSLLYFCQMFEEAFFDFSLDTYKPSAMNSSLLCGEALVVINAVKKGQIKEPNIEHVIEELCDSIERDPVVLSLLDIDLKEFISILKPPKTSMDEKKTTIEVLLSYINLPKYKLRNEELLVEQITRVHDRKVIRNLARSYGTTLLNFNYSERYISDSIQKFFYHGQRRVEGNVAIIEYIKLFPNTPDQFCLIYKGLDLYSGLEDAAKVLNISISEGFPEIEGVEVNNNTRGMLSKTDGLYLKVDKVEAMDLSSAKQDADERLKTFGTIFSLFHHKEQLSFKDECLVINLTKGEIKKRKSGVNPMLKCVDTTKVKSLYKINEFITKFGMKTGSFQKFANAAQLHSMALNSDSEHNQIINLWIAFESIIPANNDKSNISNIVESTLPFLNLTYYPRLVRMLTRDLINWNEKLTRQVLNGIDGETAPLKMMKLLSLPEHKEKLDALKQSTKDFHLLNDRIEYYEAIMSSPKMITSGLETHSKRVSQQIRRIYRARNLIVHTGVIPTYTKILIENLHDYLDLILETIIELNVSHGKISTIEQGFKFMELKNATFIRRISAKGFAFSNDNIKDVFY
ncbi:HEPN domain-containing protein [Pantoea sp. SO10]|uniref:HEPN domain-containing protein n=1 Tax=Pantoea sp. SO10 TaxID=2575375 RepID=UPI0010C9D538|nr:HEPN domain-containing protein [Pantoea sp. SO10]QCP60791.1 hypothetical protein FCN45_15980 [Pantoea sp. SO10]